MSNNHKIYERFDKVYEAIWYPFFKNSFKNVCNKVNELPGKKILEVGVGPGESFKHYDNSKTVIGTDISESMIKNAQDKIQAQGLKNIEVIQTYPSKPYPFEEESFDTVISFSVISVVRSPKEFISKIQKFVKPGGYLIIVAHLQNQNSSKLYKLWNFLCEPFTKLFMGFRMTTSEEILSELPGYKLESKFTSGSFLGLHLNTCYLLKKDINS